MASVTINPVETTSTESASKAGMVSSDDHCSAILLRGMLARFTAETEDAEIAFMRKYQQFQETHSFPLQPTGMREYKKSLARLAMARDCAIPAEIDPDSVSNCTRIGCLNALLRLDDEKGRPYLIKDWILHRPYLFIRCDGDVFLIKNRNFRETTDPEKVRLELLNIRTGTFEAIKEKQLSALLDKRGVNEDSLVVMFNIPYNDTAVACYPSCELETLMEPNRKGLFYNQVQRAGLCVLHAANAFVGKYAVLPSELGEYTTGVFKEIGKVKSVEFQQGSADASASAADDGCTELQDIEEGIDLGILQAYLIHLAQIGRIESKYKQTVLCDLKITIEGHLRMRINGETAWKSVSKSFFKDRDRLILGSFAPLHASAFRKKPDGSWVCVDPLEEGQEEIESLSRFLKEEAGRVGAVESLDRESIALKIIYLK